MPYQNCGAMAQSSDRLCTTDDAVASRLSDANINPKTGLATDYLNHFNEAIMLLDMLASFPECLDDFMAWRPMSYREHFFASRLASRDLAIAAYEAADPAIREHLEMLVGAMNAVLEATHAGLKDMSTEDAGDFASRAAALLRPLAARTSALINGDTGAGVAPQAVVDGLMKT